MSTLSDFHRSEGHWPGDWRGWRLARWRTQGRGGHSRRNRATRISILSLAAAALILAGCGGAPAGAGAGSGGASDGGGASDDAGAGSARIDVSIDPASATIRPGATAQFSATVIGSSDTAVSWSADGGAVDATGLFTAPAGEGVFHVIAASHADPSRSASATVTVRRAAVKVTVAISPKTAQLQTGGSQQFHRRRHRERGRPDAAGISDNGRFLFTATIGGLTIVELAASPLAIGDIEPRAVPASGGAVVLHGVGFAATSLVTVDGVPATSTFIDAGTLSAQIPAGAGGAVSLRVTNLDGTTSESLSALEYAVITARVPH